MNKRWNKFASFAGLGRSGAIAVICAGALFQGTSAQANYCWRDRLRSAYQSIVGGAAPEAALKPATPEDYRSAWKTAADRPFLRYPELNLVRSGDERLDIDSPLSRKVMGLNFRIEGDTLEIISLAPSGQAERSGEFQKYQKKGLATALVARVLLEHPGIRHIAGDLVEDNKAEYQKALGAGLSRAEALRETPAYKMRRRLGFGRVIRGDTKDRGMIPLVTELDGEAPAVRPPSDSHPPPPNERRSDPPPSYLPEVALTVPERAAIDAFKERNRGFKDLGEFDNVKFMDLAQRSLKSGEPGIFFALVSPFDKEYNGTTFGDKALNTAYSNLRKKIFMRNLARYPHLKVVIERYKSDPRFALYQDFKTFQGHVPFDPAKLADPHSPESRFMSELQACFRDSMLEFQSEVLRTPIARYLELRARGDAAEPAKSFNLGVDVNPDLALVLARGVRYGDSGLKEGPGRPNRAALRGDLEPKLNAWVGASEAKRESAISVLAAKPGGAQALVEVDGVSVLSVDTFDLIRKIRSKVKSWDEKKAAVRDALARRYGVEMTDTEVEALESYFNEVDRFVLDPLQRKRVILSESTNGFGSAHVDVAGMGALQMEFTAQALARAAKLTADRRLSAAIEGARGAERKVTDMLELVRLVYADVMREVLDVSIDVHFTGDDGVAHPREELTPEKKLRVVQLMAERLRGLVAQGVTRLGPANARATFLDEGYVEGGKVDDQLRSKMNVQAEQVEKDLRVALEKVVPHDSPLRARLSDVTLGIDFHPSKYGGGTIDVLSSSADPEILAAVRAALPGASAGLRIGRVISAP